MFDENLSFRSTKVSRPIEEVKKILKDVDYSNIGDLIEYYTSNDGTTFFMMQKCTDQYSIVSGLAMKVLIESQSHSF